MKIFFTKKEKIYRLFEMAYELKLVSVILHRSFLTDSRRISNRNPCLSFWDKLLALSLEESLRETPDCHSETNPPWRTYEESLNMANFWDSSRNSLRKQTASPLCYEALCPSRKQVKGVQNDTLYSSVLSSIKTRGAAKNFSPRPSSRREPAAGFTAVS